MYEFIQNPNNVTALRIPRLNFCWGTAAELLYPDYIVRFFKKDAVYWAPFVHSTPEISYGERIDIDKKMRNLAIRHEFTNSYSAFLNTANRYTDLEVEKLALKNKDINLIFVLWKSIWLIFEKFFIKGGYKNYPQGLILSVYAGFYKFTSYVKYWEYLHEKNRKKNNENTAPEKSYQKN